MDRRLLAREPARYAWYSVVESRNGVDGESPPAAFPLHTAHVRLAAQRPLRRKVRAAASLFPRALSTTEQASKLSLAPLFCDCSRSYNEAMQDGGNGGFLGRYVRTTRTNERRDPSASESPGCPGQVGRPLWSGEWLKRAAAASKFAGNTLVAHFDHAVRDRVVETDLPEALLRDSSAREHARSASSCRLAGP